MKAFLKKPVALRLLALICGLTLAASLIPPLLLSSYNHASYDDFGYSIRTRQRWTESGSVWETVQAAAENTAILRHTWQGTFASCFVAALQPALFGESHYRVVGWLLIGAFLLSLGALSWQLLRRTLQTDRTRWFILYCLAALVMMQMIPCASEAYFWWNGGVIYSLVWCCLALRLSLWLKLESVKSVPGRLGSTALLALFSVAVGGGNFVTPLFGCVLDVLLLFFSFRKREKSRWEKLFAFLAMLAAFAYSMTAPGNAQRAQTLSGGMSAVKAILQSFYFGLGLTGHWFSPALAAFWFLSVLLLWDDLRKSGFSFSRPWLAAGAFVCLFCCQLTPTLFTGNYLGDGRAQDLHYYTYVLLSTALALYLAGWAIRRFAGDLPSPKLSFGALAAAAVLALVGCVSYHPEGTEGYGPQNMLSGSCLRALCSGQAARYDEAMRLRDAEMNDPSLPDAELRPVEDVPDVFMGEALDTPMQDYVLSLYAEYYQKNSVSLAPAERR